MHGQRSVSRRNFARLFALGGSAALFSDPAWARQAAPASRARARRRGGRRGVLEERARAVRDAARPGGDERRQPVPRLAAGARGADARDAAASTATRRPTTAPGSIPEKENTRKALAEFLRVTPDEIIITRNTSESNNLVSNGLDLKAGDEVIVHADNHPSNLDGVAREGQALRLHGRDRRRRRTRIPGTDYYVDAFTARDHAADEGAVASRTSRARSAT